MFTNLPYVSWCPLRRWRRGARGPSGARGQQLTAAVVAHGDVVEGGTLGQPGELLVGIEVPVAGERLGRGGRAAQLGRGRVHREAAAAAQDAPALAERADGVVEEEEDDRHGH